MAPSFSDRMGITGPPALQLDNVSYELKMALWNEFVEVIFHGNNRTWRRDIQPVYKHLNWQIDRIPYNVNDARDQVKNWFFNGDLAWHKIYNLIEVIVSIANRFYLRGGEELTLRFNRVLEQHNSGYRFLNGELAPITNPEEIEAIGEVAAVGGKFAAAGTHMSTAISMLSQKPEPDYRNSIKESISAVESVVKIITGNKKGDLRAAMPQLEKIIPLHGAMKEGIVRMYGYTSDEEGIRHSLLDEPNVGFDEAKYMMVVCSGFVHYLISKAP